MTPKNVQMPNPNPKYKPPGTPVGGRGGNLMEIEKLSERLDDWEGCDAVYKGKFVEANCRIASRLLEEAAAALEQLQAENEKPKAQVPRWIPVEERLPKKGEDVLVHYAGGRIDMDWVGKLGAFRWEEVNGEATHWMHLPQPPKEGKKDD